MPKSNLGWPRTCPGPFSSLPMGFFQFINSLQRPPGVTTVGDGGGWRQGKRRTTPQTKMTQRGNNLVFELAKGIKERRSLVMRSQVRAIVRKDSVAPNSSVRDLLIDHRARLIKFSLCSQNL